MLEGMLEGAARLRTVLRVVTNKLSHIKVVRF